MPLPERSKFYFLTSNLFHTKKCNNILYNNYIVQILIIRTQSDFWETNMYVILYSVYYYYYYYILYLSLKVIIKETITFGKALLPKIITFFYLDLVIFS
jgi:hypothetical protein